MKENVIFMILVSLLICVSCKKSNNETRVEFTPREIGELHNQYLGILRAKKTFSTTTKAENYSISEMVNILCNQPEVKGV